MGSYKHRKKRSIPWRVPARGALFAILAAIVLILLLTLFVYLGWFKESTIPIANTVIKALSAATAGLVTGRHRQRTAWWYGSIAAAAAELILWAGMSLYMGEWNVSWGFAADLLLCIAVGGAVCALFLRKRAS